MSSANGRKYLFDGFTIEPADRILSRNGATIPLQAKVFDVLLVLAENPGRLLRKEELIQNIWPEDFVEEGNLARHVSTLRKALGYTGKEHKYIATVPGHGYRFLADVTQQKIDENGPTARETFQAGQIDEAIQPAGKPRGISRKWLLLIPLVAILLYAAAWISKGRTAPSGQIKSLAVLPLRSLNTNDQYLGIGIADAVIRRISQTRELIVRPTSAVLHYSNQDTDALTAARELSADAVLEGTVQRADERLRVSINLLRAGDGVSLWADNFDFAGQRHFWHSG